MSGGRSSERLLRAALGAIVAGIGRAGALRGALGIEASSIAGFLPGCIFRAIAGVPCPGCGMTRALLLLGQGRIEEAWVAHPLAVPLALGMLWFAAALRVPAALRQRPFGVAALTTVVGVWIVRAATGALPL